MDQHGDRKSERRDHEHAPDGRGGAAQLQGEERQKGWQENGDQYTDDGSPSLRLPLYGADQPISLDIDIGGAPNADRVSATADLILEFKAPTQVRPQPLDRVTASTSLHDNHCHHEDGDNDENQ